MDAVDRNFLRMSGRIRALEQLATVLLIDWAARDEGDPLVRIEAARKFSMLTLQMQERPIDEASGLEAGALIDGLDEIFAQVRRRFQTAQSSEPKASD